MNASNRLLWLTLIALSFPAPGHSAGEEKSPLEIAAERGGANDQFELARALLSGNGIAKDPAKALEWMKKAAAQNHPDALGGVGYFYAKGVAVPEDDKEAIAWFRKGAERGSAKAQLNLGLALARGDGGELNQEEGLRWIDCAAQSRLLDARYAQGETYLWGQFGRTVDYLKAMAIFRSCAEEGHINSQVNLGVILREGMGTKKDEAAAIEWFRKAAARGNAKAQSLLGHTLGIESPDKQRKLEALKWVMLAADQGEITAVKSLEELLPNLPTQEQEDARKLANEVQKDIPSSTDSK
jgi:TPR repeat protein